MLHSIYHPIVPMLPFTTVYKRFSKIISKVLVREPGVKVKPVSGVVKVVITYF